VISTLLTRLSWPVRVLWIIAALLPNSLTSEGVTQSVLLWVLWGLVALATWLHHPISLTVVRSITPVVTAWLLAGLPDASWEALQVASAACSIITLMLIFTAEYGLLHVQAGAYGDERRYLLKIPAPLVLPTLLAWGLLVLFVCSPPVLLAQSNFILGIPGSILGLLLLWKLAPQLHRLSCRWLVRVPAGWVVHDSVVLAENLMVRKHDVVSMKLALSDSEAIDLTGMTRGVPIEVQLRDMTDVRLSTLTARQIKTLDVLHVKAFMVAPSRSILIIAPDAAMRQA
jgi:hypothetical protein